MHGRPLRDYHTKWRKQERERQTSYDNTYMEPRKWYKGAYLFKKKNRFTDIENKLMVTKRKRRGDTLGVWDNRYTLLYIKW